MENLGVKPETLEKYGAVSSRTAMEMAEGVRKSPQLIWAGGYRYCRS